MYDLRRGTPARFKTMLNTPLLPSLSPFSLCIDSLSLHPVAAAILDDIRLLINGVLELPAEPTTEQLQILRAKATFVKAQLSSANELHPTGYTSPPSDPNVIWNTTVSTPSPPASTPSSTNTGAGSNISPKASPPSPLPASDSSALPHRPQIDINTQAQAQAHPPSVLDPDFLYASIRLAGIIYASAIADRQSLKDACAPYFADLLPLMWRISLARWKSLLGVCVWVLAAILQAVQDTPFKTLATSVLTNSTFNMAMEDWQLCIDMLRRLLRLQEWLRGGADGGGDRGRVRELSTSAMDVDESGSTVG